MTDGHKQEEDTTGDSAKVQEKGRALSREAGLIAGAILIGSLIISAGIFSARGGVEKTSNAGSAAIQQPGNVVAPQPPDNAPSGPVKVSTDDDPVLGDKNAPVTLIEFSDYECPFCKRSFDQLLPELKKNYIDTGKVKLVFRDFPLSFHANAGKEAEAAECARAQGNDATYFKYHDQIFAKTTSNGTGLALTELPVIAKSLGLDVTAFQQCLDAGKFKDEVAKDMADGVAVGVSGTPSWIVGASSQDGIITGNLIVGAQPFSAFKTVIDEMLSAK